jgi:ABC-type amino acid transport substrate-binding protein
MSRVLLLIFSFLFLINASAVNAQSLKVGVITENYPFSWSSEKNYKGLAVELWKQIAKDNHWSYTFVSLGPNITQALEALKNKKVDVIAGPLPLVYDYSPHISYSLSFYLDEISVATRGIPSLFWTNFVNSFTIETWVFIGIFMCLFLIFIVLTWLLDKQHSLKLKKLTPEKGVALEAWSYSVSLGGINIPYPPKTTMTKTFTIIWMFASMIFTTAFTGLVCSSFTASTLNSYLRTTHDLMGKKLAIMEGDGYEANALKYGVKPVFVHDLNQAFVLLNRKEVDGVMGRYIELEDIIESTHMKNVIAPHLIIESRLLSFAFAKGHPLLETFNLSLAKLQVSGRTESICKKYLGEEAARRCVF